MKLVVDTNVLVSAFLSNKGAPFIVVKRIMADEVVVVYSPEIEYEYRDVLARPEFKFDALEIEKLFEVIENSGICVEGQPWDQPLPDASDAKFLEAALAGEAKYLVTGNLKDFPEANRRGVMVISPRELVDKIDGINN